MTPSLRQADLRPRGELPSGAAEGPLAGVRRREARRCPSPRGNAERSWLLTALTSRVVPRRSVLVIAVFALIAAACSGASSAIPSDAVAVRVNSDISVGSERLLLAVVELDGTRLGSPDDEVRIRAAPDADPSLVQDVEASWIWTI